MKYPKTKSKIVREEPDEVSMDEYAGIKETRDKPLSNEEISEFFDDLFR